MDTGYVVGLYVMSGLLTLSSLNLPLSSLPTTSRI